MSKIAVFGKVAGAVTKAGGKTLLKCKKFSPEILLVGGIACGIAAVVTAVIATKKASNDEELADIEAELEDVEAELKNEEDKEQRKVLRTKALKLWGRKAVRFVKLYILPIGLTIGMVVSTLAGFGIIKGRYLGTVAACTALQNSFEDYRKRIRDIAGPEAEQRFYDGTDDLVLEKVGEDGKKHKETVQKRKDGLVKKDSPYEFDFNKGTAPFVATTDSAHNFMTLRSAQEWANDKLHATGHLFLNQVLEEIGIKEVPEGQVLGWLAHGDGDGYVDFGVTEYYTDEMADILDGNAPNIHLNFNCDGVVYNLI